MGRRFGEPQIWDALPIVSVNFVVLIGLKEQTNPALLMAGKLFWLCRSEFSHLGNLLSSAVISKIVHKLRIHLKFVGLFLEALCQGADKRDTIFSVSQQNLFHSYPTTACLNSK